MAIEFRCSQCGRLLRTEEGTAGRMAQCPECGSQTPIPFPADEAPVTAQEVEIIEPNAPGSPFAGSGESPFQGDEPFDSQAGENPYQSPRQTQPQRTPELLIYAKGRVEGPAIGLIVTGALGLITNLIVLFSMWAQLAVVGQNMNAQPMPNFQPQFGLGITLVESILGVFLAVLVLVGGIKMKKLESYSLSMAASIIAVIPCFSPCCLLGLPIGIWALMVLSDVNVKSSFR